MLPGYEQKHMMFSLFSYSKENEILVEAAAEMDRVDVLSQKSMSLLSLSP